MGKILMQGYIYVAASEYGPNMVQVLVRALSFIGLIDSLS